MAETQKKVERVIRRGPYPELTWQAVLVGYGIGALLSISFGYACLILGFSLEGSELAAMLGFVILRGVMRRNSIVENNINQTIASGVNGATAGMMFSVPALFILGHHEMFDPVVMVFSCIAGGVLGIAFIIPLRKQMIDYERLAFPGGIAVASILKSPGAGVTKAKLLVGGALLSGLVHFLTWMFHYENWNAGSLLGLPEYLNIVIYISLMTVLLDSFSNSFRYGIIAFGRSNQGNGYNHARISANKPVQASRYRHAYRGCPYRDSPGPAFDYRGC